MKGAERTPTTPVARDAKAAFLLVVVPSVLFTVAHCVIALSRLDFANGTIRTAEGSNPADFFLLFSAAKLWHAGAPPASVYDVEALQRAQEALGVSVQGVLTFNYPPTYLIVALPFGWMSYAWAFVLWLGVTGLVFVLGQRALRLSGWECLAITASPAAVVNIAAGQNGFLMGGLMLLALAGLDHLPRRSGAALGLLTWKPQLGLLFPVVLVARRRWDAFVTAALTFASLVLLSLVMFGVESWARFFEFAGALGQASATTLDTPHARYSVTVLRALRDLGLPSVVATIAQLAVTVAVAHRVYRAWQRDAPRQLQIAVTLLGVLLVTPYGLFYDLPITAVALVLFFRDAARVPLRAYERFGLLIAWFVPMFGIELNAHGAPITPFVLGAVFLLAARRLEISSAAD